MSPHQHSAAIIGAQQQVRRPSRGNIRSEQGITQRRRRGRQRRALRWGRCRGAFLRLPQARNSVRRPRSQHLALQGRQLSWLWPSRHQIWRGRHGTHHDAGLPPESPPSRIGSSEGLRQGGAAIARDARGALAGGHRCAQPRHPCLQSSLTLLHTSDEGTSEGDPPPEGGKRWGRKQGPAARKLASQVRARGCRRRSAGRGMGGAPPKPTQWIRWRWRRCSECSADLSVCPTARSDGCRSM